MVTPAMPLALAAFDIGGGDSSGFSRLERRLISAAEMHPLKQWPDQHPLHKESVSYAGKVSLFTTDVEV
jgi:surfactin synthase thioesterase subunit